MPATSCSRKLVSWLLHGAIMLSTQAVAALPPRYLEVKDFQKCLAEKQSGSFQTWCLPAKRAAACPKDSWRQLKALKGSDSLPRCAAR